MEAKLKKRKLDALRRGVHRMAGGEALPVSTHVVGIGRCGIAAITAMLRGLEPGAPKFSALAVDIGEQDFAELRALAATVPVERAEVVTVALEVPGREALFAALRRYPEFLTLEYPRYAWGAGFEPWLEADAALPASGPVSRAVAKAVYGIAYYQGSKPMRRALQAFADGVEAARAQSVIAIVFGLGGGTGSGIAVDLARHLSGRMFGRRVLVTGVGVAPCAGDGPERAGARLFPVLNELDCLGDEEKNQGVVASCGELFRNPFTAGFLVVPQQHVWEATHDLAPTHARVAAEVADLLVGRGGINLWETLRLLNWVAAPSTQHSAARTPWGAKWMHLLAFADVDGPVGVGAEMGRQLGLRAGYAPEYVEVRTRAAEDGGVADKVAAAFRPEVAPQVVDGGRPGSVQFVLPCVSKADFAPFFEARDAYDAMEHGAKVLEHSMLLELGVLLSERSSRLEGMAGESLSASAGWIAVPYDALRGGDEGELQPAVRERLEQFGYAD